MGRPGGHIDHQGVGSNQEGKSTKGGGPINARGGPFDHSGGGGPRTHPLKMAEKGSDLFAGVRGQS